MSEPEKAGHESGRGHGPGGRLLPMEGDKIEICDRDGEPFVMAEFVGGESPFPGTVGLWYRRRIIPGSNGGWVYGWTPINSSLWRWPHLETLGIRGSFCCERHGLVEPLFPLTTTAVQEDVVNDAMGSKKE